MAIVFIATGMTAAVGLWFWAGVLLTVAREAETKRRSLIAYGLGLALVWVGTCIAAVVIADALPGILSP